MGQWLVHILGSRFIDNHRIDLILCNIVFICIQDYPIQYNPDSISSGQLTQVFVWLAVRLNICIAYILANMYTIILF